MKNKGRIVFTGTMVKPEDPKSIWKMASNDPQLIHYLNDYAKRKGVKVIEQRHNVIQTENEFIMAFWECDLTKAADA